MYIYIYIFVILYIPLYGWLACWVNIELWSVYRRSSSAYHIYICIFLKYLIRTTKPEVPVVKRSVILEGAAAIALPPLRVAASAATGRSGGGLSEKQNGDCRGTPWHSSATVALLGDATVLQGLHSKQLFFFVFVRFWFISNFAVSSTCSDVSHTLAMC